MFCPKCGTEVTDGAFCPKCGTKVMDSIPNGVAMPQTNYSQSSNVQTADVQSSDVNLKPQMPKKKNNTGKVLGIIAAIVAVLVVVLVVVKNHKTTVYLDKYVVVEFEGYNTLGKATPSIDWEAFDADYNGKIKVDKKALRQTIAAELSEEMFGAAISSEYVNQYLAEILDDGPSTIVKEYIGYGPSLDVDTNLSNGDEVKLTWDIDEDDIEEMSMFLKCNLKYSDDITYTVTGLENIGTFDPFADVTIEYLGTAPNGEARINYDSSNYGYYLNYNLDKSKGLSNGDTITATVNISGSEESFVESYGKLPSPTEKEYTVNGLMTYISSAEDIPDGLMSGMQSQAEDVISSYTAKKWDEGVVLKSLTYLGNYFLIPKSDSSSDKNRCVLVYKLTSAATLEDKQENSTVTRDYDSFYFVTFKNLLLDENGAGAVDISDYSTPSDYFKVTTDVHRSPYWKDNYYILTYTGFPDIENLYNEVVTKNLEKYTHEDNVVK